MHNDELKKWIRICGENIAKNADDIVGDNDRLTSVRVTISISPGEYPNINIDRDYNPDI